MKEHTCCFTGHRHLPKSEIGLIIKRLNDEIENLYRGGVTNFISGGALGFDQIAASLIAAKKEMGYAIRLIFILPCKDQDSGWTSEQKRLYRDLLARADEIRYASETYRSDCLKTRNARLVEESGYCIAYLTRPRSGTAQTVRLAKARGLVVLSLTAGPPSP